MRACTHPERDHIHIQMAIYDQLLTRLHAKDDEVEYQAHVVALRPVSRSCIERIAEDRDRFWEAAPGFGVSKRRNVQFCVGEGKQEHMSDAPLIRITRTTNTGQLTTTDAKE